MRMLPFLLMTLHFSQIGFTDDLTFMADLLLVRIRGTFENLSSGYLFPDRIVRLSESETI